MPLLATSADSDGCDNSIATGLVHHVVLTPTAGQAAHGGAVRGLQQVTSDMEVGRRGAGGRVPRARGALIPVGVVSRRLVWSAAARSGEGS